MFNTVYTFKFLQSDKYTNEPFLIEHLYSFKGKGNARYIVQLQEFKHKFLAIKFYHKSHRFSKDKYSILTKKNDAQGCIRTCIEIMLSRYKLDNKVSFGFIGANLLGESINNTKRFRIYKQVMENFFSPIKFSHYSNPNDSTYLMLNNEMLKVHPEFFQEIKKVYLTYYVSDKPTDDKE